MTMMGWAVIVPSEWGGRPDVSWFTRRDDADAFLAGLIQREPKLSTREPSWTARVVDAALDGEVVFHRVNDVDRYP